MKPLFLALRAKLNNYDKIQSDFSTLIQGKWVADENLHITINYFGDKYSKDELLQKLPPLIIPIQPLNLYGLGYFEKNNILYSKSEIGGLDNLSNLINKEFSLKQAKEFIPHVTLMRIKNITDRNGFQKMIDSYKNEELGSVETNLELMESEIRHPGGAVYSSIKKF
ncbi:2'-5' RNA ligase family protein [Sulfurimonas sp.]|uniref:2'-5' RNA ligase family protein n=1 Tax=Sulfurimonas sp. TaxID=2022749 RepID=UPI003568D176